MEAHILCVVAGKVLNILPYFLWKISEYYLSSDKVKLLMFEIEHMKLNLIFNEIVLQIIAAVHNSFTTTNLS